jgi:hypothetical protein
MPIYSATVTAPTQFDGLTAATGLFDPAASTGGSQIQVRINSINFSGASAITDWTLALVDPSDSQSTIVLTDTTVTFSAGGPSGFMLTPTNSDGVPWNMTLVSTGMTGVGILKIDWDFETTEG